MLIGHEGHEEILGTMGEAPDHIVLVQDTDEAERLELLPDAKVAYLTQTTLSVDDAEVIIAALRRRFPHIVGPSRDDICYATQNRQEAVNVLEKRHADIDLTIVDLALPGVNGFELIGALSRAAKSKIIATTAVYKDIHLEMSGTLGAHAAIRKPPAGKPLPEKEWLATVHHLIGTPGAKEYCSTQREDSFDRSWNRPD